MASNGDNKVYKVTPAAKQSTVAGNGGGRCCGDGHPATEALLDAPSGVAVENAGNLYIADTTNNRIRFVSAQTGLMTTIAGPGGTAANSAGAPTFSVSGASSVGTNTVGDGALAIQARVGGCR